MTIPIFYNPRQDMKKMVSLALARTLPIIRTPWLVVKAAYNTFPDVEIIANWEPLTVDEISVAHDRQYVMDILRCRKQNGFGCMLESAAEALPWESASFYHAAEYAVRNRTVAMSPTCYKWNKVTQPGSLRCVECDTDFEIDSEGHAFPIPD